MSQKRITADYPNHAYSTARLFRTDKRMQIRAALKAVDQLKLGCAYLPGDGRADVITVVSVPRWIEWLKEHNGHCVTTIGRFVKMYVFWHDCMTLPEDERGCSDHK